MSEISERYRKIAGQFTQRARSVPDDAWDNPAPCEGWVARDVVGHMVEWMPGFFRANAGLELPQDASVDEDPVGAAVASISMATPTALYEDRWITCSDTDVIIRGYYLPLGTPKVIPYGDIQSVATVEMRALTGKGRLWGTASPRYWAHLDLRRPWKTIALVLDVGRRVKPFITPADPDRVREIIDTHRRGSES